MHTTQQARTLWCPMVRIARRETTVPNPNPSHPGDEVVIAGCNTDALGGLRVPKSCRCIADQCAMWRWGEIGLDENDKQVPTRGFCGLAGKSPRLD